MTSHEILHLCISMICLRDKRKIRILKIFFVHHFDGLNSIFCLILFSVAAITTSLNKRLGKYCDDYNNFDKWRFFVQFIWNPSFTSPTRIWQVFVNVLLKSIVTFRWISFADGQTSIKVNGLSFYHRYQGNLIGIHYSWINLRHLAKFWRFMIKSHVLMTYVRITILILYYGFNLYNK